MNLLVQLTTLDVNTNSYERPDISHLPKLTDVFLYNGLGAGDMTMKLPVSVKSLHIRRKLVLRGYALGFPVNLGELTQLTKLCIEYVYLNDAQWLQVQTCAALCLARDGVGLRYLSLICCGLKMAPEWIAQHVGLEHLDLSENKIQEFPPQYADLVNLRSLSIGNDISRLGYVPMQGVRFPDFIYALPRLESLDISGFFEGRPSREVDDFFVPVLSIQMERLTHLTSLNMSANRFRVVRHFFSPTPIFVTNCAWVGSRIVRLSGECFVLCLTRL